jgi:hypothetical protein
MRRQLEFKGYETVCVDPNIPGTAPVEDIRGCGAVVLMSPHKEFKDLRKLISQVGNPDCWFVDLWGFWSEMRHRSDNGYFRANEVGAQ